MHKVAAKVDLLLNLRASGLAIVQEIQFQYKRGGGGGTWFEVLVGLSLWLVEGSELLVLVTEFIFGV